MVQGNEESDKEHQLPLGNIQDVFKAWKAKLTFLNEDGEVIKDTPHPRWEPRPLFDRKRREVAEDKDLR